MRARHDEKLIAHARRNGLGRTLEDQHRVVLRDQALAAGLSRAAVDNLVRRGRWRLVLPGVMTDHPDPGDVRVRICAASLWAGPEAVIAGRTCLVWRGLVQPDDYLGRIPLIEIYLPPERSRIIPDGLRIHRARVAPGDVQRWHGIAVTSTARACLDLARWGAPRDYLEVALRRRFTAPEEISRTLAHMTKLRGHARAARAAHEVATCPWSPPERTIHSALTGAGVTGWVANTPTTTPHGELRPDIAFQDIKLAVEIKGRRYHDEAVDPRAFDRDHWREQALVDAGWEVLNFTAKQIEENLAGVLATILRRVDALRSRLAAAH